jgi:hypothetical protein
MDSEKKKNMDSEICIIWIVGINKLLRNENYK